MGPLVANRYELLNEIGRGGQGIVCRARDVTDGRLVAVKMLNDSVSREPAYVERLARERTALLALKGTNAVELLDLCRSENGSLCLVMELLDGRTLEDRLAELEAGGERMPISELVTVMGPVAATLDRAHAAGIVHRDIKPANLFLTSDGGVRLLDFGLARLQEAQPLTAMGTVMGSPSCIAPEVWKGHSHRVTHRADLYSLGVIVFRALSGSLPFSGESLLDTLQLVTTAPRPSLRALRPDLSAEIDAWVQRALAIEPNDRFGTASEMWRSFLAIVEPGTAATGTAAAAHEPRSSALGRTLLQSAEPAARALWSSLTSWIEQCSARVAGALETFAAKSSRSQTPTSPEGPPGNWTATNTLIVPAEDLKARGLVSKENTVIVPPEEAPDAKTLLFIRNREEPKEPPPDLPTLMHMPYSEVPSPLGPVEGPPRAHSDQSFVSDWLAGSELRSESRDESPAARFPDLPPPPKPRSVPPVAPETASTDPSDSSVGTPSAGKRSRRGSKGGEPGQKKRGQKSSRGKGRKART